MDKKPDVVIPHDTYLGIIWGLMLADDMGDVDDEIRVMLGAIGVKPSDMKGSSPIDSMRKLDLIPEAHRNG